MRYSYVAPVVMVALAVACKDSPTSPDNVDLGLLGGSSRLSLTATQSAEGLWENRVEYDWKAQRYPSEIHVGHDMRLLPESDRVEILPGQVVWVTFQVDAQRRLASEATMKGVRGQTCVTNTGRSATREFAIVEQVMASVDGQLRPVEKATAVVRVEEKLEAGLSRCFDYEILFDARPGVTYHVMATVVAHAAGRIVTHAGADFSLPAAKTTVEIDADAWMRDGAYEGCAKTLGPDFTCVSVDGIPRDQHILPATPTAQPGMSFMVDIKNEGVCGQTFVYTIDEPLREGGPNPPGGEIRDVSGSLVITTGECPPPKGGQNCVLTEATWRAKYGDGANPALVADFYGIYLGSALGEKSLLITSRDMVRYVFARAGVTTPIGELYAQLYFAKLNILAGADPRPIRDARIAADAFFATHTAGDWNSLSEHQRQAVRSWVETLTKYNEGRLGPPVCGSGGDDDDEGGNSCTRTIGYWKNHAGLGPQSDVVTRLLPVWLGIDAAAKSVFVSSAAQAAALLGKSGDASNGINKLYAQLLAAKLNVKSGADGSAVLQTVTQADVFLATHDAAVWTSLTTTDQHRVLAWASILDDYNNGRLGTSHCN